jgi:hypothetical protein
VHFAAGPWFTVQKLGEWKHVDTLMLSDGVNNQWVTVQLKLDWAAPSE